ncbi:glucose 1-dehydrogenase [Neobacillus sp. Marseille-QA0830]
MRLQNKVAIITGAGGGMGQAVVQKFLDEGAKVAACDLQIGDSLQQLSNRQDQALLIQADVTESVQVEKMAEQTLQHFGRIDILVNLAGIAQSAAPIEKVTEEQWDRIMAINTKSLFLTGRAVIPYMKQQKSGSIVNIASISAVRPRPGLNAYVASKGAALAFTQALAIELAEYKIRVNAVNPGPAETNMLQQFAAEGTNAEEAKETVFQKSVPLGELIQPDDIANVLVYLCSDEASRVTGAIFNIDGGRGI